MKRNQNIFPCVVNYLKECFWSNCYSYIFLFPAILIFFFLNSMHIHRVNIFFFQCNAYTLSECMSRKQFTLTSSHCHPNTLTLFRRYSDKDSASDSAYFTTSEKNCAEYVILLGLRAKFLRMKFAKRGISLSMQCIRIPVQYNNAIIISSVRYNKVCRC